MVSGLELVAIKSIKAFLSACFSLSFISHPSPSERVERVSKFLIRNPKALCFPVERNPESVKEAVLPQHASIARMEAHTDVIRFNKA